MYNPKEIKEAYDEIEHGKARMSAIRTAWEKADEQGDVPYQIFFRLEMCHESCFYGDGMDMLVIFPEILALMDQHPDAPVTEFQQLIYADSMDHVLWVYKWLLDHCVDFYQIPLEDCLNFFEDAKKRFLAYGYNLRPWYLAKYNLYVKIDADKAAEAYYEFEKLPRDFNSDCEACERNTEISFYLKRGDVERAAALSEAIEDFTLTCKDKWSAWLRMKKSFMHYYMKEKKFDKALEYCRMMERNMNAESEYKRWDDFLACYAYLDLGKALKIYKEHWKEWLKWRNPADEFRFCINVCRFFRELREHGEDGTGTEKTLVKLPYDSDFPLYQESGQYETAVLYDYYYRRAKELAEKFDTRNRAEGYGKELEEALCMTR
jgi:hypothetical protein